MRVLLANKFYVPRGGAESVVLQTHRLLEEAGHEVVPFAMRQEGDEAVAGHDYFVPTRNYFRGSTVARTRDSLASIYSFEARRRLRALLHDTRPDLAHLHNVYHQLTLSLVDELVAARIPVVMTLHDYKAACPNYLLLTHDGPCERCVGGHYWNAIRHRCLKGSLAGSAIVSVEAYVNRFRRQYGKIDLLLAPSTFLHDVMVRAGLPGARLKVLRNAVPSMPQHARTIPGEGRFLYAGRLSAEKGLDVLLSAAARLREGSEIRIFGSGPLEDELRRRCDRERLPVRLCGFASHSELARELSETTALVLPSQCYENCPMSVLEAGQLGVPTIASDIGGIPELVADGSDGLLVSPGDAAALADTMNRLAADRALAERLGEAARRRVTTHHSEDGYRNALIGHYEEVLLARAARGS